MVAYSTVFFLSLSILFLLKWHTHSMNYIEAIQLKVNEMDVIDVIT